VFLIRRDGGRAAARMNGSGGQVIAMLQRKPGSVERDLRRDRTEARLGATAAGSVWTIWPLLVSWCTPALLQDDRRQCTDSILVEAVY
jgi:hypothetical protein